MVTKKDDLEKQLDQAQAEVEAVIICDDIRREINGKAILIGVYDGIVVHSFPADLVLSCWIQFRVIKSGPFTVSVRLMGPHDVVFGEMEADSVIPNSGLFSFVVGGMYAPVQLPGDLKVQFKSRKDDWRTIKTLNISKAQTQPVSANQK